MPYLLIQCTQPSYGMSSSYFIRPYSSYVLEPPTRGGSCGTLLIHALQSSFLLIAIALSRHTAFPGFDISGESLHVSSSCRTTPCRSPSIGWVLCANHLAGPRDNSINHVHHLKSLSSNQSLAIPTFFNQSFTTPNVYQSPHHSFSIHSAIHSHHILITNTNQMFAK